MQTAEPKKPEAPVIITIGLDIGLYKLSKRGPKAKEVEIQEEKTFHFRKPDLAFLIAGGI